MIDIQTICETEIEGLHQFFQDWFNGVLSQTEAAFAPFPKALGAGFTIVSPEGRVSDRNSILKMLWEGHGAQKGIRIWIEGVRVRFVGADMVMALYEEWQQVDASLAVDASLNKMPASSRISSVLFKVKGDQLVWLHVHETWLS
jgi:hypothetical protein